MKGILLAAALAACSSPTPAPAAVWSESRARTRHDLPPRKVIVATVVQGFWVKHPGLQKRLQELGAILDEMAAESKNKYGRGPDLAVLPETSLTGESQCTAAFDGEVREFFAAKARGLNAYIVVSMNLVEDGRCSNACVLVDRKGEKVGTYRKMHLVPDERGGAVSLEGGMTPGREAPVFECDFGRVGLQICYDIEFETGWQELARRGADLVAWPSQTPQTIRPAARALKYGYYVVSSTWKQNASIFDPVGRIIAQVRPPKRILVEEIDLSFAILNWSAGLQKGKALQQKFGDRVGFRYYEDEDRGVFWSNDASTPIGAMVRALGLPEDGEHCAKVLRDYDEWRSKEK